MATSGTQRLDFKSPQPYVHLKLKPGLKCRSPKEPLSLSWWAGWEGVMSPRRASWPRTVVEFANLFYFILWKKFVVIHSPAYCINCPIYRVMPVIFSWELRLRLCWSRRGHQGFKCVWRDYSSPRARLIPKQFKYVSLEAQSCICCW